MLFLLQSQDLCVVMLPCNDEIKWAEKPDRHMMRGQEGRRDAKEEAENNQREEKTVTGRNI